VRPGRTPRCRYRDLRSDARSGTSDGADDDETLSPSPITSAGRCTCARFTTAKASFVPGHKRVKCAGRTEGGHEDRCLLPPSLGSGGIDPNVLEKRLAAASRPTSKEVLDCLCDTPRGSPGDQASTFSPTWSLGPIGEIWFVDKDRSKFVRKQARLRPIYMLILAPSISQRLEGAIRIALFRIRQAKRPSPQPPHDSRTKAGTIIRKHSP